MTTTAEQRGAFLTAPLGTGRVAYCALGFTASCRRSSPAPAAVPGAYRRHGNLVSAWLEGFGARHR